MPVSDAFLLRAALSSSWFCGLWLAGGRRGPMTGLALDRVGRGRPMEGEGRVMLLVVFGMWFTYKIAFCGDFFLRTEEDFVFMFVLFCWRLISEY